MKHDFHNENEFAELEEAAIDGQLDYSEFPPAEYRYFSQLARLGWLNRHKSWSKEICEKKQGEYRRAYYAAVNEREGWIEYGRMHQRQLIRATALSHDLNFAKTKEQALPIALDLIEQLLEEPGLAKRIKNNLEEVRENERNTV